MTGSTNTNSAAEPPRLTLELRGAIPAFKNRKRICRNRLITDPDVKKRLEAIATAIESQLLCAIQTSGGGTLTGPLVRSWTLSNLPADDCWTAIPQMEVTATLADEAGATITIERL